MYIFNLKIHGKQISTNQYRQVHYSQTTYSPEATPVSNPVKTDLEHSPTTLQWNLHCSTWQTSKPDVRIGRVV